MLGESLGPEEYTNRLADEIRQVDYADLGNWSDLVFNAWEQQANVFIIGNGGSAASATHMSQDFAKSLHPEEQLENPTTKRLRVQSLTDNVGWLTAVANDLGYEHVFTQQLRNLANPDDLLIAISGSGSSKNILHSVTWANDAGLVTFGLTGFDGGSLDAICQHGLNVAVNDMGMSEGIHLCLYHWVLNDVFARINQTGRYARS